MHKDWWKCSLLSQAAFGHWQFLASDLVVTNFRFWRRAIISIFRWLIELKLHGLVLKLVVAGKAALRVVKLQL